MGYKDGVRTACGVLQLKADMNLTKSIPAPVTPELILPYSEEECAPLPLKEFLESEEDIDDLTDADADGGDGSGGKKTGESGDGSGGRKFGDAEEKIAEDAEQEPMNVDKNTEAKAEVFANVAVEDTTLV
ncbi:hypothetical protein RHMOL_Rhmol02G0202400 [Rhododendron molle]|uniref:Uncharacterized protein n=1 Tax=Rhododendron molle TaxID=49168 RepID=A0ACC0PTJ5_RHOML|nr:hypothetical protein RHMOL_Rhmol02G0202400 [Rhododendron molle]